MRLRSAGCGRASTGFATAAATARPVVEVAVPSITVVEDGTSSTFPVRRVYCVGKNYAKHTIEMGGDPKKDPPCFFSKPSDAVNQLQFVQYPPMSADVQYEVEQVVAIGKAGSDIAVADALDHVFGYGVGVDLTRRDLQWELKDKGLPWELAKGWDNSAPCSAIVPRQSVADPLQGEIGLKVNGEVRQLSDVKDHVWSVPETLSYLSSYVTLMAGDLIFMGTPEGVGPLTKGDRVEAWIEGIAAMRFEIV